MSSLWVHPGGDSILVFQNRQVNFLTSDGKVDLYAYNINQDTILWRTDDITANGNSSIQPPIVYEDKVYFQGGFYISCFDALTGELIWMRDDFSARSEHFFVSNMVAADGILAAKADNDFLFGYDANTGETIWKQTDVGASSSEMIYHDGKVYYTAGKLYAIDIRTGNIHWALSSPNPNTGFSAGVAIDKTFNYLYANDRFYAMCIRLD